MERVIVLDHLFSSSDHLYVHGEEETKLPSVNTTIPIEPSTARRIPPGAGESFYMEGVGNTIVVSGFDEHYEPLYGSSFSSLGEDRIPSIHDVANSVSSFVATLLKKEEMHVEVSLELLDDLLHCFAVDGKCGVIERTLGLEDNVITLSLRWSHSQGSSVDGRPIDKSPGTYDVLLSVWNHL